MKDIFSSAEYLNESHAIRKVDPGALGLFWIHKLSISI
jgi:hypothetical protein